MDVLTRIQTGSRNIEFALATTKRERAAVLAQRFRVYQRKGYYRPGYEADRDDSTRRRSTSSPRCRTPRLARVLLGSARLILGESRSEFRFPAEEAFEFELPAGGPRDRHLPSASRSAASSPRLPRASSSAAS